VFALPAETQTGSNTVGFLQNENLWVNYGQVCHFLQHCLENSSATYFRSNNGTFLLDAVRILK
jgi:hypothetical protein